MQELMIYMDDSGVLCKNDEYVIYGGLYFTDIKKRDHFKRKYKAIVSSLKCGYCESKMKPCDKKCPELKNSNTKKEDKRRIVNLLKKQDMYYVAINIKRVYENILSSKLARGRYKEYAHKLVIKQICNQLIQEKEIDPKLGLKISIYCDQDSTASNGLYRLEDGILEEFKHGVINWDYGTFKKPIYEGRLRVIRKFEVSSNNYLIQAADFVAGNVRRSYIDETYIFTKHVRVFLELP